MRRTLSTELDDHAAIAARHLEELEASRSERLEQKYPLAEIFPSPVNPRRLSLDNANVNLEQITKLAIKPRETFEAWSARMEAFLDELVQQKVSAKSHTVWSELVEMAMSVYKIDLIQPIIAKPDGEIIAGERRWTACLMAGKQFTRVIIRTVAEKDENLFRLIENLRRSDLSVPETALSLRKVMADATGAPCGPDNEDLTMDRIQEVLGAGTTQSAYYRAICRLPENDPLLSQIVAGGYTSLRIAYEDASRRLRELQVNPNKAFESSPAANDSPDQKPNTPPSQPQTRRAPSPPMPQLKSRIPGTEGGHRFIAALSAIEGVGTETLERIKAIGSGWAAAPEKARKKMLTEALEKLFADLDQLDEPETTE
ncbi:ParB N-terminal domain-containing protein [Pseudomonas sp.]|uniref:ParB N-terminal domain-containing protein n=1 Tax=Pseudomonas sp. TaxID=306 RepID=UPI002909D3B1|nr:ParB N-terminal domain-containing protein [Pseudomonas sp.]MDU4254532.1 ParB N-terminal domain-containing protein [Pseudomonas sp.]